MTNNTGIVLKRATKLNLLAHRLGWEDVRMGREYYPAYERMDTFMQNNYERGRLSCANVIASGQTPTAYTKLAPLWRDGRAPIHPDVVSQSHKAVKAIGPAMPETFARGDR